MIGLPNIRLHDTMAREKRVFTPAGMADTRFRHAADVVPNWPAE